MNATPVHPDHSDEPDRPRRGGAAWLSNPYVVIALVFGMVGIGMMAGSNMAGLPFLVIGLSFWVISLDSDAEEKSPGPGPGPSA
ncbi:hypothetical protein M3G50_06540 [Brachybacterium muris]|uniref:hypothetical protein n=1 Tax=Brachybacterium muris TaxID=219301 RepID=UPI0021A96D28|nr:hypothetical protein [Brachybacterium muris]MCT1430410.1 hypothetical protein [Brachybacterium muris]